MGNVYRLGAFGPAMERDHHQVGGLIGLFHQGPGLG